MCIHHFFYHNPDLLVRNPYFTSISHCDYVNRSLDLYHSQPSHKPLEILGTEENPEALRMPEACPINWGLGDGQEPPEIGSWRAPSWEIQENLDAHAEIQRGRGRGRRRGGRRGELRMSHPWDGGEEREATDRTFGPATVRGNVSCRVGWLEDEGHQPSAQASHLTNAYQTPLAQAPGIAGGLHASELPATLPPHTISPPLTLPSTAYPTNVPSPAILPGMFASFSSAPASHPIELPTPETDVFWTGNVPWLAEGLSEDEVERMRQEEEERRMFAMGRVEDWRGQGNGDGGMDFFNHEISRAPIEGHEPQMYGMESLEAWNGDRVVWGDTPPIVPNPNASTMEARHGHQPPPWPAPSSHPTPLNPTATPFTMPPPTPQQHQIPQSPPQQPQIPHQRNSPIIITSTNSETLMQDLDWVRWEQRRQWEELFGRFVAQAKARGEDYSGGVEGLMGPWFVR